MKRKKEATMDFDKVINRYGTNSTKYDFNEHFGVPKGVLPFWIADMDFPSAPCIAEALKKRLSQGIFGYSFPDLRYFAAIGKWMAERHHWKIRPEWGVPVPDAGTAIAAAVLAFTKEGEAVLVNGPCYDPFQRTAALNHRRVVDSPLVLRNGKYEMDFDDMEKKITENHIRLFILCSPQNPTGRVWTREELERYGELAVKHGAVVFADEVHEDFAWKGHPFTPFGTLGGEIASHAVICTSPVKSFNLGGLPYGNLVISNPDLRKALQGELLAMECTKLNLMSITASQAAYAGAGPWLDEVRTYIESNIEETAGFLKKNIPKVKLIMPEATYLLWIDCRGLGLSDEALQKRLLAGGVWVNMGAQYGPEGSGFIRFNIACPKKTLREGLARMARALSD